MVVLGQSLSYFRVLGPYLSELFLIWIFNNIFLKFLGHSDALFELNIIIIDFCQESRECFL